MSHPLVRTYPVTGRQALFCSGLSVGIEGMPEAEGKAIVDEVIAFSTQSKFVYTHVWRKGDVVFWDDRSTMHLPMPFDLRPAPHASDADSRRRAVLSRLT